MQSHRTLEIVHNFGRAPRYGQHLHVYNLFAATMPDSCDDEVDGDAGPKYAAAQPSCQPRRVRRFEEVDRWSHDDHSQDQIDAFVRRHLKAMNDRAGLKTFPGAHKDRNPKYGLMQHGRTWYTKKGTVTNIVLQCPLVDRCSCLCEVKLAINADQTIMYVTNEHTAENHAKEKDISRHLSYEDKVLI